MLDEVKVFHDDNGFFYKYPERSCSTCLKYPCIPEMDTLLSDFARYGCYDYYDFNMRIAELEANKPIKRRLSGRK